MGKPPPQVTLTLTLTLAITLTLTLTLTLAAATGGSLGVASPLVHQGFELTYDEAKRKWANTYVKPAQACCVYGYALYLHIIIYIISAYGNVERA